MPTAATADLPTEKRSRKSAAQELESLLPRLTGLASHAGVRGPGVWKPTYLATMAQSANVTVSAKVAGVSRQAIDYARDADPEFARAEKEAMQAGIDLVEASAFKSATYGDLRPVFQGGVKVGEVVEYSDAMRALLLKGRRREVFGDKVEHSGIVGRVHLTLDDMRDKIGDAMKLAQVTEVQAITDENGV